MRSKTVKLKHKFLEDSLFFAEQLFNEGKTKREILDIIHRHVENKIKKFYTRPYPDSLRVDFLKRIQGLDSKAEAVVFFLLERNKIEFKSQFKIGPYRVDFLIDDFLILEIDGHHHGLDQNRIHDRIRDRYLEKLGYEILRIPIWVFSVDEKSVLEEIKEVISESIF